MQTILIILAIILFSGVLIGLYFIYRKLQDNQKPKEGDQNLFLMMQNQIQELSRLVDRKITDTHKTMNETQQNLKKTIPVDSKFSLENYNRAIEEKDPERKAELENTFKRDLKNRIDETSKYIKPKENTMDFAFMFIPAEGIYYDLLINKVGAIKINTHDLIEYAFKEKHVIIVSPTSFLAYLQTVMQGLRALKIEESAKEIRKR